MEMVMYFSLCISSLLNMYALQTNKLSLDLKILVYLLYDYERACNITDCTHLNPSELFG